MSTRTGSERRCSRSLLSTCSTADIWDPPGCGAPDVEQNVVEDKGQPRPDYQEREHQLYTHTRYHHTRQPFEVTVTEIEREVARHRVLPREVLTAHRLIQSSTVCRLSGRMEKTPMADDADRGESGMDVVWTRKWSECRCRCCCRCYRRKKTSCCGGCTVSIGTNWLTSSQRRHD